MRGGDRLGGGAERDRYPPSAAAERSDPARCRGNPGRGRSSRFRDTGTAGRVLAGLYLLVHLADPTGIGAGDVKLALGLGALTGAYGFPVWFLGALGAALLTVVVGVVAILRHHSTCVPHGPSMCVASLAAAGLAVF